MEIELNVVKSTYDFHMQSKITWRMKVALNLIFFFLFFFFFVKHILVLDDFGTQIML